MYNYQYVIDPITRQFSTISVKRLPDNAFIPFDPANTDYQQYLAWLTEGNKPLPTGDN